MMQPAPIATLFFSFVLCFILFHQSLVAMELPARILLKTAGRSLLAVEEAADHAEAASILDAILLHLGKEGSHGNPTAKSKDEIRAEEEEQYDDADQAQLNDDDDDGNDEERHPADMLLQRHKADATISYILGGY